MWTSRRPTKSVLLELPRYYKSNKKRPFSSFSTDSYDNLLWRLRPAACLPVRHGNGDTFHLSCSDTFFIGDQKSHVETFESSLPLIDFTVDQVRHMRPIFEGLGILHKSLRACVKSTWEPVGTPVEDAGLTEHLRGKAELLCRQVPLPWPSQGRANC